MSLIAWYKLDGNPNNELGTYTGSVSGTVTYPTGLIKQSAFFNTGRIDTNIPDSITGTMSISLWYKKTTDNWAMSIGVIGTRNGNNGWMLYRNSGDTAGFFRWYMHYNTTSSTVSEYYPWPGISGLTHNRWYHFVIIRESNGASRLYVDGNIVANLVPPANFSSWRFSAVNVGIAAERAGSTGWNGTTQEIDDVKMYDHVLSDYEINELSKAKILHYTFNDPNEEPTENILFGKLINTTHTRNFEGKPVSGWQLTGVANDNPRLFIHSSSISVSSSTYYAFSALYFSSTGIVDDVYFQFSDTGWPEGNIYLQPFVSGQSSIKSGSSTITNLGGGWFRCVGTFLTNSTTTTIAAVFLDSDVAGTIVFIGDLQLEKKSYATPYTSGIRNIGATDISGYGINGDIDINNTPRHTTISKIGAGAFNINGTGGAGVSGGIVTVPHSKAQINAGINNPFTFSMWLRPTGTAIAVLIRKAGQFELYKTASNFIYRTWNPTSNDVTSVATYAANNWYHLVATHDGVSTGKLYINGVLDRTISRSGTPSSITDTLGIGGYPGREYAMDGIIDDFRFYGTELSLADVQALYQSRANFDNRGNVSTTEFVEKINYLDPAIFTQYSNNSKDPGYQVVDGRDTWRVFPAWYHPSGSQNGRFKVNTQYEYNIWIKHSSYWTGGPYYVPGGFRVRYTDGSFTDITSPGATQDWVNLIGITAANKTIADLYVYYFVSYEVKVDINSYFVEAGTISINNQGIADYVSFNEVDGTENTNAQQEIKQYNKNLLINGEFSEVD
jgi:hypothetical protein